MGHETDGCPPWPLVGWTAAKTAQPFDVPDVTQVANRLMTGLRHMGDMDARVAAAGTVRNCLKAMELELWQFAARVGTRIAYSSS